MRFSKQPIKSHLCRLVKIYKSCRADSPRISQLRVVESSGGHPGGERTKGETYKQFQPSLSIYGRTRITEGTGPGGGGGGLAGVRGFGAGFEPV